ncbi:hypothetical protein N431DRAFT_473644 [Stipitochalara longipes BDJ]|nr:hypothetical protein N431DRAFT_473644 [Stipitochalara longipes BDJ]
MAKLCDIYSYTQPSSFHRPKSTKHMPSQPIFLGSREAQQYIAVVIQNLDGPSYLVLTSICLASDATECLKRIQHEYEDASRRVRKYQWHSFLTKNNIGIAHVQFVIPAEGEPTTRYSYPTVFLSEFSHNDLLCHSWKNPAKLGHHRSLKVISDEDLIVYLSGPEDLSGKRAIVMREVLSKTKLAFLLLALLVLGTMLGVIVGICTGRADIALAVAASSFACVTILQSLAAWLVT